MAKKRAQTTDEISTEWQDEFARDLDRISWTNRYAEQLGIDPAELHIERKTFTSGKSSNLPLGLSDFDRSSEDTKRTDTELERQYRAQEDAKRAAGRLTLEEAASLLADAGERFDVTLTKLVDAVQEGALPTYEPGRNARIRYDSSRRSSFVRPYHDEVFAEDLNAWLDKHERRITYRFSALESSLSVGGVPQPVSRQHAQEEAILSALRSQGFDPERLPAWRPGQKSIAKQAAFKALRPRYTPNGLTKAWQQLRKAGRIKDASS